MSTGDWNGYVTRAELANVWGCAEGTVQGYAKEASRRLTLDEESLRQSRIAHAAFLRDIQRRAATLPNAVTGLPDFGNAIKAAELAAKFEGHDLANHVELTGKGGGPLALATVTLDDVDALSKVIAANNLSDEHAGATDEPSADEGGAAAPTGDEPGGSEA